MVSADVKMGTIHRLRANRWGWIALAATIVSLIGYIAQTVLDHVNAPAIVGQLVFYGAFAGVGIAGLLVGIVAVVTGRKRADDSALLGWIAIGYVALAQLIQLIVP
jgi:hypothetical protein